MRFALLALLLLAASPVLAARGFGTTLGVGTTDSILTTYTTSCTGKCTYSVWEYPNASGGGGTGRLWDKLTSASTLEDFAYNGSFARGWSSSTSGFANWAYGAQSTGRWHHICITYDAASVSNIPIFYIDGTVIGVTTIQGASGSLATNAFAYVIGNRTSDNARNFDGRLAELAIWNITLTQAECFALVLGVSPFMMQPAALKFYAPLYGTVAGERDFGPSHGAMTVTGTAFQQHAKTRVPFWGK